MRRSIAHPIHARSRAWLRYAHAPLGVAWCLLAVSCADQPKSAAARDASARDSVAAAPAVSETTSGTDESTYAPVVVSIRGGTLFAPSAIDAGWHRLHVTAEVGSHIVVAYRVPSSADAADVAALMSVIDTARATPAYARAMGGVEGSAGGDVILAFTPGRYVLACLSRGDDDHRHAAKGEYTTFTVTDAGTESTARAPEPQATAQLGLVDFAYTGPDVWTAPTIANRNANTRGTPDSIATYMLRVENTGRQDHQVRIERLLNGATLRTWLAADDRANISRYVAGIARMGTGAVAYLPLRLAPGTYVVYCLVPDAGSRTPHIELGMLREVTVR